MTKCSILWCGAKKDEKCPELTLHRFPRNVNLSKRWLDAIGVENIKPNLKAWFICSLHFEESCFNRTLDVRRLHDNTIPSIFLKKIQSDNVSLLRDQSNVLHDGSKIKDSGSISSAQVSSCILQKEHDQNEEAKKIIMLKNKCTKQKLKIKRLNVRKRDKKIAILSNIIKDLQEKNKVNAEQVILLEDCAGPQDFLQRQISKAKGLPLVKKYSEEIRKFALTLHFLSPRAYNFVRKTYNTCLPHSRTLSKWFEKYAPFK